MGIPRVPVVSHGNPWEVNPWDIDKLLGVAWDVPLELHGLPWDVPWEVPWELSQKHNNVNIPKQAPPGCEKNSVGLGGLFSTRE